MSSRKVRHTPEKETEAGWTFDNQGDYANSGASRWELAAAVAVVAVWVGIAFHHGGLGSALRCFATYLLPLAYIWKRDIFSFVDRQDPVFPNVDAPRSEWLIRLGGWIWLLFPLWEFAISKLLRWFAV
jgi:hypothetical protein